MRILTFLWTAYVHADYLSLTGFPTRDCSGDPYIYAFSNVNPCTIPDGPRVSGGLKTYSHGRLLQADYYYESIQCINSTSWVRYGYESSSCTTPTISYNETGFECSQSYFYFPGVSASSTCITSEFVRPTSGLVVSNIATRDECIQEPISVWGAKPNVCLYETQNQVGMMFVCGPDNVYQLYYSDSSCLGSVIDDEVYNYGCNLTVQYSAPRLLDCYTDVPEPPSKTSSLSNYIAVIAGAVGGSIAFIAIVIILVFFYNRRQTVSIDDDNDDERFLILNDK